MLFNYRTKDNDDSIINFRKKMRCFSSAWSNS